MKTSPERPRSLWARATWRKSLAQLREEERHEAFERSLGLFDLIMIGIGGTVGSGVFATAGLVCSNSSAIARYYAGPAAVLSWIFAGIGCILSSGAFMELSCLIPADGSTYAYAYHALGELPATIAGFLLTLEYGISSAGNARAWSAKFVVWLKTMFNVDSPAWMRPAGTSIDLYAGLLLTLCVLIVLGGMSLGKRLINAITLTKISVVLFIIIAGLTKFEPANISPFVPAEAQNERGQTVFGWPGVMLGASASFYGYIGYDEVCCLAGEAINPRKNIPRAVLGTVLGAAALSILATLSIVGMQKYSEINVDESYGEAFKSVGRRSKRCLTMVGYAWASPIVETGEVVTMPVGILIGFLAQPRVQCAMAQDGLMPAIFGRLDAHRNPRHGAVLMGLFLVALATVVEFHVLWNFISLGILLAFNLTNLSLLVVRYEATPLRARSLTLRLPFVLGVFSLASWLAALHLQESFIAPSALATPGSFYHAYMTHAGAAVGAGFAVVAAAMVAVLAINPPRGTKPADKTEGLFQCPGVPLVPCLAMFFNWLLAVQMPMATVVMMAVWLLTAVCVYLAYGVRYGGGAPRDVVV
ncbi:Amino Acid-Polyamine-Organocation (APC) Family [Achlya hypogyna]|uniref:Amino Acid-Polyamine-Organocation (APC) Family n=1 Tax=Achlya hypogyna TaxID=1202772 RepID=A0A1V9ZSX2_ACHHY|nr:Amino Acid-Polyamine-Organocation (APC) Family [Achlya hypogyna]